MPIAAKKFWILSCRSRKEIQVIIALVKEPVDQTFGDMGCGAHDGNVH